jgi:hypothetical protein
MYTYTQKRFKLTWFPPHSYGVLQNYCGSYCYCEKRKAAMRGDLVRLMATTSGGDSRSHSTDIPNLFAGYLYKCSWKLNLYEKTICASSARWAVKVSMSTHRVCDVCGSEVSDCTSIKESSTMCIVDVVWVQDGEQTMTWHSTAALLQVSNCEERKSPTYITNINRFNIHGTVHRSMTSSNNQRDAA